MCAAYFSNNTRSNYMYSTFRTYAAPYNIYNDSCLLCVCPFLFSFFLKSAHSLRVMPSCLALKRSFLRCLRCIFLPFLFPFIFNYAIIY